MKTHHTFTITIPTASILAAGAGALIGFALVAAFVHIHTAGLELAAPVAGLPLVVVRAAVPAAVAPPVAFSQVELVEHPAVMHWLATPAPVRAAFDEMVDRVLIAKYSRAEAA